MTRKEAEQHFRRSVAVGEELVAARKGAPDVHIYHSLVGAARSNLAMRLWVDKRLDEARDEVERAIQSQLQAIAGDPKNATYRQYLSNHYSVIGDVHLDRNDHVSAADSAAKLRSVTLPDGGHGVRSAYLFVDCRTKVNAAKEMPSAERVKTSNRYAAEAVASLRLAVKDGWRPTVLSVRNNSKFVALRTRKDFQEVLKEIEGQGEGGDKKPAEPPKLHHRKRPQCRLGHRGRAA